MRMHEPEQSQITSPRSGTSLTMADNQELVVADLIKTFGATTALNRVTTSFAGVSCTVSSVRTARGNPPS